MPSLDDILRDFPGPAQATIRQLWGNLSAERRRELEDLLAQLPGSTKTLKDILGYVADQYKPVIGAKRRIAIVGPVNVGKSTLYNQLIARPTDRAAVSPVPGTTRRAQQADAGLFTVVDTPGADAAGAVGDRERQLAFGAAKTSDFLVIVFEATHGVGRAEKALFDALTGLGKPFVVVVNKIDLTPKAERDLVIEAAARALGLERPQIIDTVATDGVNVGRIILAIARAEPELLGAIGAALPQYRGQLAWSRIIAAGGAAAVVAFVPLPLADLIPLLGIQTGLVLSISRIYNYRITPERARELIVTFGVGLMARRLFQELSKLGGVPGWLLSAAIAASTTVAIGYAAIGWFSRGERPSQAALGKLVADVTTHLKERLMDLGHRRPDKGTLQERVMEALKEAPLPRPLPPLRQGEGGIPSPATAGEG
ncbi:MAG: 50S ribosome-binding GTPase [Chloroflexi bacterium]|nr:50S ribosome-binding GTPase [Chloroflexota bacterium]